MYVLNRLHRDFNHRKQPVFTTEDTENTEKYSFYPRIALIGTNKAEALAVDWIFSIRLTGNMNIAGRRSGKIRTQDIHRKGAAILLVWIRTLRGFRYPGISSLSEYEPILKIFAI